MEYLLDTHTFLWFINGDKELSDKARETIEKPDGIKYVSIASFWEIAIKVSIGKLTLDIPFDELQGHVSRNGFEFLPVTFEHTAALIQLNFHHKDPFDRILISQAITERLTIISRDSNFVKYNVISVW